MAEEAWHEARLIPTSGINGPDEQERRATSALLAVMTSVREFGRALTQPLGAPAGQVLAYIEVPFAQGEAKVIPDGLLRVCRGSKTCTALVEVKTGTNESEVQQLENYLDVAQEQGFDALVMSCLVPSARTPRMTSRQFGSSSGRCARSRHLAEAHPQVLIIALRIGRCTCTASKLAASVPSSVWGRGGRPADVATGRARGHQRCVGSHNFIGRHRPTGLLRRQDGRLLAGNQILHGDRRHRTGSGGRRPN